MGTPDGGIDQRSGGRLIAVGLARTRAMTNTTTNTKPTITKTKSNGEETSERSAASTNPGAATTPTAPEKKPITVTVSDSLFRKSKILSQLSGKSLSELVEEQLKVVVKERLPALLAGLDVGE